MWKPITASQNMPVALAWMIQRGVFKEQQKPAFSFNSTPQLLHLLLHQLKWCSSIGRIYWIVGFELSQLLLLYTLSMDWGKYSLAWFLLWYWCMVTGASLRPFHWFFLCLYWCMHGIRLWKVLISYCFAAFLNMLFLCTHLISYSCSQLVYTAGKASIVIQLN